MSAIIRTVLPLGAGLVLAFNAFAQDHPHEHGAEQAATAQSPAEGAPATPEMQAKPPAANASSSPKVDHAAMGHAPAPSSEIDHAAMGHAPAPSSEIDHAAMGHAPAPSSDVDHAAMGHAPAPSSEVDHAAMGHAPAPSSEIDHAAMGHAPAPSSEVDHAAMGHGAPRPAKVTPVPPPTDAERAAAVRPVGGHSMGDNARNWRVLVDRLEAFDIDGEHGLEWEAEAWAGTDLHKLWLRTEGERVGDDLEDADLEVLYGRSIAPWWDAVAGVRHHFEPGQAQDMAVFGVKGLAPYKIEVEASLYIGDSGYTGARVELEYETFFTNRLILQPTIEANLHGQDDRAHGNGSGLGMVEAGLRLRYEVTRHFAPYLGVVHQRAYGRTADFRREAGEVVNDTRVVGGVRVWF